MKLFYKYISFLLCMIIAFSVFSCCISLNISAESITTMYIEGKGVNVRSGPGTEHSIIEKVTNRSATVLESTQGTKYLWYKVSYFNGSEVIVGYVAYDKKYIRIVTYDPDADFESKVSAFPESYRQSLRTLHQEHPNWEFVPEAVNMSFADSVYQQSINMRKQVSSSQPVSWRSMGPGAYDWNKGSWITTNGGWIMASREIIAFYMDPRNFLDSNNIYMFLQQSYNKDLQTEDDLNKLKAGVKKIIAGTFMETNYTVNSEDPEEETKYGGDYTEIIMAAAATSGVSPYIIASKIRQEIGTNLNGNSPMVSGTYEGFEGYYNFFNFSASGKNTTEVITNGLTFAQRKGWNTRSKAIIDGAVYYSKNYIAVNQDTYYYQDFNVHNPDRLSHQYAQAVHDAYSKGSSLAKIYSAEKEYQLTFKIPVFMDMPDTASPQPEKSGNLNNYYLANCLAIGLTPTFDKYEYEYSLKVSGDSVIKATPISNATLASPDKYDLVAGENVIKISVKSSTGYINDYKITINADVNCVLYVNTTGTFPDGTSPFPSQPEEESPDVESSPEPVIIKGDTNADGEITLRDLANIRLHLLNISVIEGDNLKGADTDGDGTIALRDLANLRLHLLGLKSLTE